MGIFKKVNNIFRAKVNGALDDMENPIELLDQKVRDMDESLNKAKLSSAQILGNVHEIEKKMTNAKRDSEEFDEKVKLAMSKGNEDLAKKDSRFEVNNKHTKTYKLDVFHFSN